jgi:hypothetical protein
VFKPLSAALGLAFFSVPRLAPAQPAETWRDPTDYLEPATPSAVVTGVNVEPQPWAAVAPNEETERAWYGHQVLISDLVSVSLLATGLGLALSEDRPSPDRVATGLLWAGALGYTLAPAAIHVAHERPAIAFASASLRFGLPVFGLLVGASSECSIAPAADGPNHECKSGDGPALVGLFSGIFLSTALDAGLFSYDRPQKRTQTSARFGLLPYLSQDGKRAELRAFGAF